MRSAPLSALFGLTLAAALAAPGSATTPEVRCQKAVGQALSACVSKASAAVVACLKKGSATCPETEKRIAAALAGAGASIAKKCADAGTVAAAGYPPLLPAELGLRVQQGCAREVDDTSARVFGPDGSRLAGASPDDRKCLLAAGKEAGKLLARSIDAAGRCAGQACEAADLDRIAERRAALESKAAAKIGRRCPDLAGLVGLDPSALAREAGERVEAASASPCDPIDEAHCLFPFSNDYFSVGDVTAPSGRRIRFAREALPANTDGVHVDPTKWNAVDGFSVGPTLLFQNEQLDLAQSGATPITDLAASLDPSAGVLLLDAATGERQLLWVERDAQGTEIAERALIGRVGANLENGHRYLVAVRGARDGAGNLLASSPAFVAYRDRIPSPQLPIEARRPHMERIFAELESFGVERESLYLAWDFTTQSTESSSAKLLRMRDDAFENVIGSDQAPGFTVTEVIDAPDAGSGVFRRVEGTVQVPLYLTNGGGFAAELRLGADGLPVNEGDFYDAEFLCVIPEAATTGGAPPAVPARASLYGHGLLGSRGETGSSHVRAFANAHNFVMCGTDWTGFAEPDIATVAATLAEFSVFPRFIEKQLQGVLNFMVVGRALLHPEGFASHPAFQLDGQSLIDPSGLFYDGNSQGGILGGVLAAFAQDIDRFVLGVPGINYSTLLDRSTDFAEFNLLLTGSYPSRLDRALLIAVGQLIWDQTDPNGHVRHTTSDPYPKTPPKKILYQVAFGDHQVAPVTVEIAARSNGAHIHTPVVDPGKLLPEVEPYYGIPAITAYPFDGSAVVVWDSWNPAPPIENVPPPEILPTDDGWGDLSPCAQNWDSDPHECPRRAPEARLQKSEFLRNGGAVVDTCGGLACQAPTF